MIISSMATRRPVEKQWARHRLKAVTAMLGRLCAL
jgi:hypothetical protein